MFDQFSKIASSIAKLPFGAIEEVFPGLDRKSLEAGSILVPQMVVQEYLSMKIEDSPNLKSVAIVCQDGLCNLTVGVKFLGFEGEATSEFLLNEFEISQEAQHAKIHFNSSVEIKMNSLLGRLVSILISFVLSQGLMSSDSFMPDSENYDVDWPYVSCHLSNHPSVQTLKSQKVPVLETCLLDYLEFTHLDVVNGGFNLKFRLVNSS